MRRARSSMPGGNTRTHGFHLPYPVVIERGQGPFVWDVDGNRYIDLQYNGTSLIHGHAYEPVVKAIQRTVVRGSGWTGASPEQIQYAELLCARVPSFDMVRFTHSGTETAILAAKVARKFTGRDWLMKAWYGYHGSYDDLEAGLYGRGDLPNRTLVAEFGNAESFEKVLEEHGERIAAVFVEPALQDGIVPAPPGFFPRVEAATARAGALLVLDECVTFRLDLGGAQQKYGLHPDLTMLGKIIGGGLPMGALGGSESLMSALDPSRPSFLYHGGSFNGNVLTCAAGLVAMNDYTAESIATMDRQAERLEAGLMEAAAGLGIPFSMNRDGSLLGLYFLSATAGPSETSDIDIRRTFQLACLNHGLYTTVAREWILATPMSDELIEEVIDRAAGAMADVAAELELARGRGDRSKGGTS
jgi:glutamate-1-semialdehyde 2,1-aminomutase